MTVLLTTAFVFCRSDGKCKKSGSIWLVAPLVSKLPSAIQGRILKVASQVLENGGWCKEQKNRRPSESQSLLSHQPFLSLILTCLKGQEEGQREGLLSSLHQQLSQVEMQRNDRIFFFFNEALLVLVSFFGSRREFIGYL